MKFSCDKCDAQYMISDEKVGPKGVRVRCKKCGNVIPVRRPVEDGALAEERPAPVAAAAGGAGAAVQGNLDAELGQAFDHAFGGEGATTPAPVAPASAAAEAARVDAAVPEPGALQLPAGDELPAFAVSAQPARTPAPAGPPPATEWYVAIGQAQVGPLPLEEVRRKWEGADVGPDSLVWRPGMGDWAPLSSVADLAAYLAPFPVSPRQSRTPAPSAYQAGPAASPAIATPAPGADVVWKPVGASALAALASEEIATRGPEPRAESRNGASTGGIRTLVEKMELPDGGGVDPTGAIPLPMKALETTGEHRMERISSVARGAEEIRHRRTATRGIAIAVVALLVVAGGAAAWLLTGRKTSEPAPAPAVAQAAAPAPAVPPPAAAKPAEPAVAEAPRAPEPAKPEAAPAEAPKPEPAVAEAPKAEAPKPERAAAAPAHPAPAAEATSPAPMPGKTTRAQRREALRKERLAQAAAAKAAAAHPASAAPAPAPEQPRKRRDVLDFESNDAALEAALGTGKPAASSRSVYVPPAPSGTALPERVTDSQVNETILGRVSALQQCVQEQKARDADGTGVLKMHWTIAPDGAVRDAKCVTPEFASSPIAQCVAGVLRSTRFPRSKSGRQDVTFPIKF